jgi:hypothetical protein
MLSEEPPALRVQVASKTGFAPVVDASPSVPRSDAEVVRLKHELDMTEKSRLGAEVRLREVRIQLDEGGGTRSRSSKPSVISSPDYLLGCKLLSASCARHSWFLSVLQPQCR